MKGHAMTSRRFWIEVAHGSLVFQCAVTASSPDHALTLLREAVTRGDVVIGHDREHVASIADQLRGYGENQPPSPNDGTTAPTS